MTAYYNEHDPFAAAWLRELIAEGHIADGVVDERSIVDIKPSDLDGFTQVHFFAGIGGWSYALRLAGWPDDRPVWTGSCPCQPFSAAGKKGGLNDDRHLWPVFAELIRQHRPDVVLGEQVSSADGLEWWDAVASDLEDEGYAAAAVDTCAASVGAPHRRQRLFWVGYADGGATREQRGVVPGDEAEREVRASDSRDGVERDGPPDRLGHPDDPRLEGRGEAAGAPRGRDGTHGPSAAPGGDGGLADGDRAGFSGEPEARLRRGQPRHDADGCSRGSTHWADAEWVLCNDPSGPRWRQAEPGTFPLADGLPGRVGLLRGYGNAIVPQVAAEFIRAFEEAIA